MYKKIKKEVSERINRLLFPQIRAHALISAFTQIIAHPLGYSIKQVSSLLPFTFLKNSRDKRHMKQSVHHTNEDDLEDDEIINQNYFIRMHNHTSVC